VAATDHPRYNALMARLNAVMGQIESAQESYKDTHGKYYQGIVIPAEPFYEDTGERTYDGTRKPTDQEMDWFTFLPAVFNPGHQIPCQMRMDVYNGPQGQGWVITFHLWYAGLGPDSYGNDGDHWVYRHEGGAGVAGGRLDEWYIYVEDPTYG